MRFDDIVKLCGGMKFFIVAVANESKIAVSHHNILRIFRRLLIFTPQETKCVEEYLRVIVEELE